MCHQFNIINTFVLSIKLGKFYNIKIKYDTSSDDTNGFRPELMEIKKSRGVLF